jgi:hypothetical protein
VPDQARRPGPESDRTQIGLHFAKAPVDKQVRWLFLIPAGAPQHEVRASYTIPPGRNLHAVGISPHMHLLGRSMKVTATYPDGSVQPLIYIDDWDFHSQGIYTFAKPVPLPGGARVEPRSRLRQPHATHGGGRRRPPAHQTPSPSCRRPAGRSPRRRSNRQAGPRRLDW